MSDDIDMCVILAKGVHTGALTVIAVILNLPLYTRRAWSRVENTMFFFVTYGVNTQWMAILPVQTFV